MDQLSAFAETLNLAATLGMADLDDTSELSYAHLVDMYKRITPEFSSDKLGRWLGWAQCAVVASGIGATLEDMKRINTRYSD